VGAIHKKYKGFIAETISLADNFTIQSMKRFSSLKNAR
jgi:hypothetical protein